MKIHWARIGLGVIGCSLFLSAACFAQKVDQWVIENAVIGPDNPIEVRAGGSYVAQAMYPNPDGPLSP